MSGPVTRAEALRLLGVSPSADAAARKRAYRRLAREHHPDRGGDADTFHRLQQAYEHLAAEHDAAPPTVARGRPSRSPAPHTSEDARTDLGSIQWSAHVPPGHVRLDRQRVVLLLTRGETTLAPVTATSRAPGSRLNRFAPRLSEAVTARLVIAPDQDDRGRARLTAEVTASGRRARRALDRVEVDERWSRTRRSTTTTLRTSLPLAEDARITAVRVTDRIDALLTDLRWPLGHWSTTSEGS